VRTTPAHLVDSPSNISRERRSAWPVPRQSNGVHYDDRQFRLDRMAAYRANVGFKVGRHRVSESFGLMISLPMLFVYFCTFSQGWGRFKEFLEYQELNRHSPGKRSVGSDFPSDRGARQQNLIQPTPLAAGIASRSAELAGTRFFASTKAHLGRRRLSRSIPSPLMPARAVPAAGRSATGFPGTSAAALPPRPSGKSRSGRG
jgi:hypothetical protein